MRTAEPGVGKTQKVGPRPSGEQRTPSPGPCQVQLVTTGELPWLGRNEAFFCKVVAQDGFISDALHGETQQEGIIAGRCVHHQR